MLTQEERAALERLRKEPYEYPVEWLEDDRAIAAKTALRDHPADDDEPVTEDWLVDCGFITDGDEDEYYNLLRKSQLSVCASDLIGTTSWCCRGMEILHQFKTRGDVRRLCQALGIELNK